MERGRDKGFGWNGVSQWSRLSLEIPTHPACSIYSVQTTTHIHGWRVGSILCNPKHSLPIPTPTPTPTPCLDEGDDVDEAPEATTSPQRAPVPAIKMMLCRHLRQVSLCPPAFFCTIKPRLAGC